MTRENPHLEFWYGMYLLGVSFGIIEKIPDEIEKPSDWTAELSESDRETFQSMTNIEDRFNLDDPPEEAEYFFSIARAEVKRQLGQKSD